MSYSFIYRSQGLSIQLLLYSSSTDTSLYHKQAIRYTYAMAPTPTQRSSNRIILRSKLQRSSNRIALRNRHTHAALAKCPTLLTFKQSCSFFRFHAYFLLVSFIGIIPSYSSCSFISYKCFYRSLPLGKETGARRGISFPLTFPTA